MFTSKDLGRYQQFDMRSTLLAGSGGRELALLSPFLVAVPGVIMALRIQALMGLHRQWDRVPLRSTGAYIPKAVRGIQPPSPFPRKPMQKLSIFAESTAI